MQDLKQTERPFPSSLRMKAGNLTHQCLIYFETRSFQWQCSVRSNCEKVVKDKKFCKSGLINTLRGLWGKLLHTLKNQICFILTKKVDIIRLHKR